MFCSSSSIVFSNSLFLDFIFARRESNALESFTQQFETKQRFHSKVYEMSLENDKSRQKKVSFIRTKIRDFYTKKSSES